MKILTKKREKLLLEKIGIVMFYAIRARTEERLKDAFLEEGARKSLIKEAKEEIKAFIKQL